jgi:hypothetical protein
VNREIHAGICEGRGVKIPPATRPRGALVSDCRTERRGKRRGEGPRQVWVEKMSDGCQPSAVDVSKGS